MVSRVFQRYGLRLHGEPLQASRISGSPSVSTYGPSSGKLPAVRPCGWVKVKEPRESGDAARSGRDVVSKIRGYPKRAESVQERELGS
jgi:hypothetical protein